MPPPTRRATPKKTSLEVRGQQRRATLHREKSEDSRQDAFNKGRKSAFFEGEEGSAPADGTGMDEDRIPDAVAPPAPGPGMGVDEAPDAPGPGMDEDRVPDAVVPPPPGPGMDEDAPVDDDQVRGITVRKHITWLLFRALSRGDFHHDFGENVGSRDKFVKEDENRFFEIAKRVSKMGSVELRAKFKNYIGKNLFKLIEDGIDRILPEGDPAEIRKGPAPGDEAKIHATGVAKKQFAGEDEILNLIGLDWKQLKTDIALAPPGDKLERTYAQSVVANGRKYEIRACPYRLGDRGTPGYEINTAPIDALAVVTGGKKNFALIVDASGGLPLSELRYRDLIKGAGGGTVYIIENIENRADSATKLLPPALKPKNPDVDLPPAPDLKFLRDTVNTINYPLWQASGDQKSNIYSSLFIILNRIAEDNVEANLIVKDGDGNTVESYSIGDVANASNVKNASLYALAIMLEKGRITDEMLVYTLIKRMGDWCQALSLLDLDREYTIYEADGKPMAGGGQSGGAKPITLRQLQSTTEIGVVTNDRILLALCILLGLNVFYTSAMDLARLIYFKNTRDLPSGPELEAIVDALISGIPRADVEGIRARIETHGGEIIAARDKFVEGPLATNNIADYILALRSLLSNLGRLRLDFGPSVDQLEASAAIVFPSPEAAPAIPPSPSSRLTAANVIISVMSKINLDIKYNESVLRDLQDPENRSVEGRERIRLAALKQKLASGVRIPKSVEVTEAKEILLETRNDIRQILGKQPPLLRLDMFRTTPAEFGIPETDRGITNYNELLSVFPSIMLLLPRPTGGQRGGAREHIDKGYAALRTRSVRTLPSVDGAEVTSTINIHRIGAFYYDEALHPYTVADEYIITKDDLPVFGIVFDGLLERLHEGGDGPLRNLGYICNRYLLLLLDIAWNDLDGMSQDAAESGGDGVAVPTEETLVKDSGPFEKDLEENSGLFKKGTPTRTRINQIIDMVTRVERILAAPDILTFVNGTVGVYLTPPTGEEEVAAADITSRILTCRNQLLATIETYADNGKRETERTGTATLEANTATNYRLVKGIGNVTYARYVEPITQEVLGKLWLLTEDDIRTFAPGLGGVIYSTIVSTVAHIAGAAQQDIIDEKYVLGSFPKDFVDDMVAAIEEWGLATVPPKNAAEWSRFDVMLYAVRTRINFIQNEEKRELLAAPAAPGGESMDDDAELGGGSRLQTADTVPSNAGGTRTDSSRRGLYARLRQRAGEGTPPGV